MLGRGNDDRVASLSNQQAIMTALESLTRLATASTGGTIAFAALPAEDDTITITDASGATVYTFKDDATAADEVDIAATRDMTMANLVDAINVNAPPLGDPDAAQGVRATLVVVSGVDNDTLTLAPKWAGADGNTTLAESTSGTRLTVVSLSGGADAGSGDLGDIADLITVDGLMVDIGGSVNIPVDLIDVDVEAITGTSPDNKTLKDLHDQLTGTVSGTLYGSGGGVADLLYSSSGSAGVGDLLYSSSGSMSVADLLYSSSAGSGLGDMMYDYLYSNSYGVAYWCEQIYNVLYDVWSNGNNSGDLRVNQ